MWVGFADNYLRALDLVARSGTARPKRDWGDAEWDRDRRTAALSEWHDMLFGKLAGYGVEDRLDRLVRHPALGGPELTFLQARLAHQAGDVDGARRLVHQGLEKLPGHEGSLDLAYEIGASPPPRAQQVVKERSSHVGRPRMVLAAVARDPAGAIRVQIAPIEIGATIELRSSDLASGGAPGRVRPVSCAKIIAWIRSRSSASVRRMGVLRREHTTAGGRPRGGRPRPGGSSYRRSVPAAPLATS